MSVVAVARSLSTTTGGITTSNGSSGHVTTTFHPNALHACTTPHDIPMLSGATAPTSKFITGQRDDVVRGEADHNRSARAQEELLPNAARVMQSLVRQFLCRRRYLRSTCFVRRDLNVLQERRRNTAVVIMQRIVRGFCTRRRYLKLRSLAENKRMEDANKKGSKKAAAPAAGKKGTPAAPPAPIDLATVSLPAAEAVAAYTSAALERNQAYLALLRQCLASSEDSARYDEFLIAFDNYTKALGKEVPEPVCLRLRICAQRRRNVVLGLPPNATPPSNAPAAAAAGKKKKK